MRKKRGSMLVSVAATFSAGCGAQGQCPSFSRGVSLGTVETPLLTEASGLAASRDFPGVLWSHNDSGNTARVFGLRSDGSHLGTYNLSGISAIDFEDMAIGRGPAAGVDYLYIGDIGDNGNSRPQVYVHRVAEPLVDPEGPAVSEALGDVATITLVYPDGPRDAETLMIDVNRDLYIVTKRVTSVGRVYRAAYPQSTSEPIMLEFVGELPWGSVSGTAGATGGDISADGSTIIVRRYVLFTPSATLWRRSVGMSIGKVFSTSGCDVSMPLELQGESVAFASDSLGYYTLGEGVSQPIWWFNGPEMIRGDLDGDGDVDLADFGAFQICFTGVGGTFGDGCGPADFDEDFDIDLSDFGGFQLAFGTGS